MIRLAQPVLHGRERQYVLDALERVQLTGGEYVERFEAAFAGLVEARHAVAVSSGTAALHLALLAAGLRPGDEVLVPALTFVATANAVRYCGAEPVIVDVEPRCWTMDPILADQAISERTVGILVTHLYGQPANLSALRALCAQRGLWLIEDCAEALGSSYKDHPVGSAGLAGTWSLHGAKTISCGEGGVVTTDRADLAERMRFLRGQAQERGRPYWHPEVGFNYRLPELSAAVALAQTEDAAWHCLRRREVYGWYADALADLPGVTIQREHVSGSHGRWMVAIQLAQPSGDLTPGRLAAWVRERLADNQVETRPVFPPLWSLPPYETARRVVGRQGGAESLAASGLLLPSHAALSKRDVWHIVSLLSAALWQAKQGEAA